MIEITIDGNEKNVEGASYDANMIQIHADMTMQEALEYAESVFIIHGVSAEANGVNLMSKDNGLLTVIYARKSELEDIKDELAEAENQLEQKEVELQAAQSELMETNRMLEAIRQAIKDIGTGIPTLSKLTAFLSAVKEAIHYDGNNDDD